MSPEKEQRRYDEIAKCELLRTQNLMLRTLARKSCEMPLLLNDDAALQREFEDQAAGIENTLVILRGDYGDEPTVAEVRDLAQPLEGEIAEYGYICRRIGYYRGFQDGLKLHDTQA